MTQVEVTGFIDAPREKVWEVYTDHAAFWSFMGSATIERVGHEDPNGTGCIRVLGPGRFAAREEILDFEPPGRITYRVLDGSTPIADHLGEVFFEEDGGGTRVLWRARFRCTVPGLGLGLRLLVRRVFTRAIRNLERQFPGPA